MNSSDELLAVFRDEVQELLDVLISELEKPPAEWNLKLLFRTSHNIKGAARMVDVVAVREAAHALEDLFDSFRNGVPITAELSALAHEGYLLLESCFGLGADDEIPDIGGYREVVTRFVDEAGGPVTGQEKDAETDKKSQRSEPSAPPENGAARPTAEKTGDNGEAPSPEAGAGTIRISVDKLDDLTGFTADLVSFLNRSLVQREITADLMKSVAELEKDIGVNKHPAVQLIKEQNRKLYGSIVRGNTRFRTMSEEFKDSLQSLRMIPIDSAGSLFRKEVRDSSRIAGQPVNFTIVGGDTEIDRALLDTLRDPLIHLIRNAVAHGIESPDARKKAGKDPRGTITLRAASRGPWVEITVSDDGRGIDIENVRETARNRKLATAEQLSGMTDGEVAEFLFSPGFTTRQSATELSGRGVGLDVVRRNLTKMSGRATLDWTPGSGTCFTLRVPLTRLTTKGLLIRIGTHYFAVPGGSLLTAIRISVDDIVKSEGGDFIPVGEELVPLLDLETILGVQSDAAKIRPALVMSDVNRRAFFTDEIVGESEFVIQELSWNLKHLPGVAGSTMIDGNRIALVLNTDELLGLKSGSTSYRNFGADTESRQKRILVVDDSVTSRTLVKNILSTAGYETVAAVDGERGWDELSESEFDLVVSDIEMPRMDGFELTKKIKSDDGLSNLPVILVTSLANEEHKKRGAEAGADSYIVKGTFDQDELLAAVERLL